MANEGAASTKSNMHAATVGMRGDPLAGRVLMPLDWPPNVCEGAFPVSYPGTDKVYSSLLPYTCTAPLKQVLPHT